MKLKISDRNVAVAALAAVFIAAAILFGMTGIRTLAAIAIFFFLPFYLILRKLDLEADERIFFAFFIGIGIFSAIVFYIGRFVPSFRAATAISLALLLLLPFALKLIKRK